MLVGLYVCFSVLHKPLNGSILCHIMVYCHCKCWYSSHACVWCMKKLTIITMNRKINQTRKRCSWTRSFELKHTNTISNLVMPRVKIYFRISDIHDS